MPEKDRVLACGRINIRVSVEYKRKVIDLMGRTGCPTISNIVTRSIALWEKIAEGKENGQEFVMKSKDGKEERVWIL